MIRRCAGARLIIATRAGAYSRPHLASVNRSALCPRPSVRSLARRLRPVAFPDRARSTGCAVPPPAGSVEQGSWYRCFVARRRDLGSLIELPAATGGDRLLPQPQAANRPTDNSSLPSARGESESAVFLMHTSPATLQYRFFIARSSVQPSCGSRRVQSRITDATSARDEEAPRCLRGGVSA